MTNFERVTKDEKTLAEFVDMVSTNCYVCGRNRDNNACQQLDNQPVAFCTLSFVEWLKQESEQ